jgi:hypothetical protein
MEEAVMVLQKQSPPALKSRCGLKQTKKEIEVKKMLSQSRNLQLNSFYYWFSPPA